MGESTDLDWYESALAKVFEIKVRARVGPEEKDDKEVRRLYEADPRHAEILTRSLGIEASKAACSPGVKDYSESNEHGEPLAMEEEMLSVAQISEDISPLMKTKKGLSIS